jgi:hypothetical protein
MRGMGRFAEVVTREAPYNLRLVHQGPVQAASLPCHSPARRRTERCHSGRAARLRAHVARTPQPFAALPSRTARLPSGPTLRAVFRCAPDTPIAAVNLFSSFGDPKTGPAAPLAGLCSCAIPFGLTGGGSRGQDGGPRASAGAPPPPSPPDTHTQTSQSCYVHIGRARTLLVPAGTGWSSIVLSRLVTADGCRCHAACAQRVLHEPLCSLHARRPAAEYP